MAPVAQANPSGMVWIPGGEFVLGTDDKESMPNERPAHRVHVDGFWMDATEVTNSEFAKFVTGFDIDDGACRTRSRCFQQTEDSASGETS